MALHRRLYRSLLHIIRQFERDKVPLLGLAGPQGQTWLGDLQPTCRVQHVAAQLFRSPPPGATPDRAFAALRLLGMQQQTLVNTDEHTREACSAWHRLLQGSHPTNPAVTTPRDLAARLTSVSLLIKQLHQEAWPDTTSYDEEYSCDRDTVPGSPEQLHHDVRTALHQHGLDAALDVMAAHIKQLNPTLFSSSHAPAQGNITPAASPPVLPSTAADVLLAVQHYMYKVLKLRHEPIEWLYDGLGPLVPNSTLANRKGAPFLLAVIGCIVCDRLGVPAVPIRAAPPTAHISPGQAALSGGALMPDDVAARQAGRTASYLPTDSWLLAVVEPAASQPPSASPNSSVTPHKWILSGVFLNVGVRGGAVIGCDQLESCYPQAFMHYMIQDKPLVSESVYLTLCADWIRSMLVACQRRGESDLVAHWLVQLLALDPTAPEWVVMLNQLQQ